MVCILRLSFWAPFSPAIDRPCQLSDSPWFSPGTPPSSTPSISQISDATDNPCRGDLSTIIESETSALSISKHIPTLVEEDPVDNQQDSDQEDIGSPNCPLPGGRSQTSDSGKKSPQPAPDSPTASATLELSTSQLAEIAAEVRNALSTVGDQNGAWLGSVVVEEASEPKIDLRTEQDGDNEDPNRLGVGLGLGDVSFNFHTLDPDLAVLLSPNKVSGGNGRRSGSTERLPPSASPSMMIQRIPDEGLSPSISSNLLSASSRSKGSPVPPPDNLPLLAESPQPPQSKRIFSSTKPHSATHIPRPTLSSGSSTTLSASSTKSRFPRSNASGPAESSPTDIITPDRRPSASSSHSNMLRPPSSPTDPEDQAYVTGRGGVDRRPGSKLGLNTPFKTSTLHNPASSRPTLRQLSTSNGPWDSEAISPSSRASSSLGAAGRRQFAPRPSLDSARPGFERLEQLERSSPQSRSLSQGKIRNRNRSMSESTGSPELARQFNSQPNSGSLHRRAIDFTGPRTARLFRDAGLLPKERDRDEETSSRQTSPIYSRSSMDRERAGDYHRQMAPSRTGYSEISTTSSTWGRARATPSVVSERVGTPFTSSSSTAPTSATSSLPPLSSSVSSALQQQREDAVAYQVLKERHQMETEALLSALSDSQNLSKVLREENVRVREENAQLRERLVVLEEAIEVMRRERERGRERERLNESRPLSRNQPTYGSSSRPHMSRFASAEHVGSGRTVSSLEGVYKRCYFSTVSRPHTAYLLHEDEFASEAFPLKGKSRAGSRLGTSSTLGPELDLISPESSPDEVVGHRRISPDHRATFMDHRDRAHSISNGFGLGHGHPSRRFEVGMEKARTIGANGLGVGGRRVASDTLSQRSQGPSSRPHSHSRPHSRPDPDDEQDVGDEDETQHEFKQPSRKSSRHLRTDSTASSIFRVPPSNMSMLMHSSPSSDDEGILDADETRRDFHPHATPKFAFKKTQVFPSFGNHGSVGNISNVSPTTANFSMSQPESPGSLRLRSDHEDHLGDMESLHFDGDLDDLS